MPDTVDDPQCVATTGIWLMLIMGGSMLVFLGYTIRVWGLALVLVALAVALYTIGTVLVWYFHGPDDVNKYLMTKLGGEPRTFLDRRPNVHDALVNNASGMLGRFMHVIMNVVFPYIILGALFGKSAGGRSLIKLAFRCTRHLRGGPAHAAVVSSAMFGTITGGPVSNVMSTGVLTIPMMVKRRFSPVFAGGVEAAASSGGAILPPVMGVAAFVLAAMTATPYGDVIIAATIPAIAYFFCLFLTVMFQSCKQGTKAYGALSDDMLMSRSDVLHLVQIFLPILLILTVLLTPKDAVGCGIGGWLLGVETSTLGDICRATNLPWILQVYQNAAGDAGATGWWGAALVFVLLFLDKDFRKAPRKALDALAEAGITISTLYLMFLALTVIDVCLNFTGLSKFVAVDVLRFLLSLDLGGDGSVPFLFVALGITMLLAVLLGMGMPAFTAHMFIFYFAVASAITPPVALAAFAAASIAKAEPMATGLSAVRSGIVMFCISFVFAISSEMLSIDQPFIDPSSLNRSALSGYENGVQILPLFWLLARLARFDSAPVGGIEMFVRLAIAGGLLARPELIHIGAIIAAIGVLAQHRLQSRVP